MSGMRWSAVTHQAFPSLPSFDTSLVIICNDIFTGLLQKKLYIYFLGKSVVFMVGVGGGGEMGLLYKNDWGTYRTFQGSEFVDWYR